MSGEKQFHTYPAIFAEILISLLNNNRSPVVSGSMSVYTSAEQATAPTCAACGRKLGIGYYYSCHVCSNSYCYAHAPAKCSHQRSKDAPKRAPLVR